MRRKPRHVGRNLGRMHQVVARHDQHRQFAACEEVACDREQEIVAEHALAEGGQGCGIDPRKALHLLDPDAEFLVERRAIDRRQPDRVLQHHRADQAGALLGQRERERDADARAHHVAARDAEVVEERQVVGGVARPVVGRADRAA
jgi:hypothetical protein